MRDDSARAESPCPPNGFLQIFEEAFERFSDDRSDRLHRWAHVAFVVAPIVFFPFRIQTSELPPIAAILLSLTLSARLFSCTT